MCLMCIEMFLYKLCESSPEGKLEPRLLLKIEEIILVVFFTFLILGFKIINPSPPPLPLPGVYWIELYIMN